MHSPSHESNDRVRESLRRLRRTEVKVTYVSARTGKQRVMETHLLEFTDTDEEESSDATVQFGIPKRLRVVLAKSNRWGRIRCEIAYAMTRNYAIALYELVCLRRGLPTPGRGGSGFSNPQCMMTCTTWGYFGSPRALVSRCETCSGWTVTAAFCSFEFRLTVGQSSIQRALR